MARLLRREPNVYVSTFRHGIDSVRRLCPDAPIGSGIQTSAARARAVGIDVTPDMYELAEEDR